MNKKNHEAMVSYFDDAIVYSKKYIQAKVYTSGRKNTSLLFNLCHLYTTQDAVLLLGYKDFEVYTAYNIPILLTSNPEKYYCLADKAQVIKPKKFNLQSFNHEVYIEFGDSGWDTTNIAIHLKGLTEEEKKYLSFLQ